MRKFLLTFLLMTSAAIPSVAQAQREDLAVGGGERGFNRGERGEREWRSRATSQRPQTAQPAPAPQAQPQFSERRGNWQPRGPVSGQDSMNTSPAPQRRWDGAGERTRQDRGRQWGERQWGDRPREGRAEGEQRRFGWNRGNNGQAVTPPVAVPQQPRRDWNNEQRERWANRNRSNDQRGDDRRWDGRRGDSDRDRWDNNRRNRDGRRYAYRTPNDTQWHDRSWYDNDNRFQRWNNDWRRDRRYDWRGYRSHNRDYYRLPRYAHPYGYNYGYRRFSIGIFLDNLFYSDRYWINDPWDYRLPPAYGPYRWVRYYDDVLLVDLRNGRVVDVIYSFFW